MKIALGENRYRILKKLLKCLHDLQAESGQDLIEYALLTAVLSIGTIASIHAVADGVIPFFDKVIAALQSH